MHPEVVKNTVKINKNRRFEPFIITSIISVI